MNGTSAPVQPPSEAVRRAASALTVWWQQHQHATGHVLDRDISALLAALDSTGNALETVEAAVTARTVRTH
jgi:hypothetical protein